MKSNYFTILRFVMALLTVLAIFAQPHIPPRKFLLHPSATNFPTIFAPENAFRGSAVQWLDQSRYEFLCDFRELDNYQSCGFTLSWNTAADNPSFCESAISDEDGDGWGWENEATCIVKLKDRVAPVTDGDGTPVCSRAAIDPDDDGWGWEYERSCIMPALLAEVNLEHQNREEGAEATASVPETIPPCAGEDADPDGDGWGWENEQSCKMPDVSAESEAENIPECTSKAEDPDGDGWGWENHRSCRFSNRVSPYRGSQETVSGIDLSRYDGIEVKVFYEGRARHMRVNMTNFDLSYSRRQGGFTEKFMTAFVRTEDLRAGRTFLNLDEFSVPEWWVRESNASREHAAPDFSNIVTVGVDFLDVGVHKARVERIELVGDYISRKDFLWGLMIMWGALLTFEALLRYYLLHRTVQRSEDQLAQLTTRAVQLEVEKSRLHSRAVTDPLTGIQNRAGFLQVVEQAYSKREGACIGLLLLDLDHFKKINDEYGHEIGDHILKSFAELVDSNTRSDEVLARWGGEEFALFIPHVTAGQLSELAEKLRQVVANHEFDAERRIYITTSVGGAIDVGDLDFEQLFKRADLALYRAKSERNQFVLG